MKPAAASPGEDQRYVWSNPAYVLMMQRLERDFLSLLGSERLFPLAQRDILEVGCGRGNWVREWVKWGADPNRLAGVDLSRHSLARAAQLVPSSVRLLCADAVALPFPSDRFDLALQATLFTSILDPTHREAAARELIRVVRPKGMILWYDFAVDNPQNPNVRAVPVAEVRRLFAPLAMSIRRVTLAPPIARWLASHLMGLYHMAAAMPLLRTHYLVAIRKS